jgi:hypothetical protein
MTDKNYAFIKSGVVVNVVVFNDPTEELLELFKNEHQVDSVILADERTGIGGTYDEERNVFIPPQPFASWVLNQETYTWEAPVPMPSDALDEAEFYKWDETTTSWIVSKIDLTVE